MSPDQAASAAENLSDGIRESLAETEASSTPAGSQAALSTIANLLEARQKLDAAQSHTATGHGSALSSPYTHQGKLTGANTQSPAGSASSQSDLSGNTVATTLAGAAAITPNVVSFVAATRSYQSTMVNGVSNSTLSFST